MLTNEKGKIAERLAADFLKAKGYQILERNWRLGKVGEIDLVAKKEKLINFVEVKSLMSNSWEISNFKPEDHFSKRKYLKLIKLASFYANRCQVENWIISLIAVSLAKDIKINYYENIII